MKYILHIGCPKTGSSSLQNALAGSREAFRQCGVVYPETGCWPKDQYKPNHAPLCKVLNGIAPKKVGMPEDWVDRFFAEVAEANVCIFSAERFSKSEKFSMPENAAKFLPQGQTRIVMYVREPVSHVVSLYKHRVKISRLTMNLRDFAESCRLQYLDTAEKWAAVFGRENVVIRRYGREYDPWDIVSDFWNLLGMELIPSLPPSPQKFESHKSIAGNCLFVKRVLNCFITQAESLSIQDEVSEMAKLDPSFRGDIPVDQETVDLIANRFREYVMGFEGRFGLSIRPREKLIDAPPCPDISKLAHDLTRMRIWARERESAIAPLLERMAGMCVAESIE